MKAKRLKKTKKPVARAKKALRRARPAKKTTASHFDPILESIRGPRFNQLLAKIEGTRKRLENDRDVALQIAAKVLAKVQQVRKSLESAVSQVKNSARKGKSNQTPA